MSKFTGNIIRLPAVTPTQNSASGVYTLDDQFTAQSSGTWPIVRDQYFNYTTLLLTGAVQGTAYPNPVTQPYSFLSDASTNNFVVSPNGDVSARPFNPYLNNYSNYFSGSSAYLSATANTAFDFGTGDFTIEAWVYTDGTTETFGKRVVNKYVSNGWLLEVLRTSGNTVRFLWVNSSNVTVADIGTNDAFTAFTWHHIAVSRSGANISLYVDGSRKATSSSVSGGTDNVSNNLLIGSANLADTHFDGYISNARLVKGTAVYDPTQTSITVPTAPLTAISGTSLLTCQSNRFRDVSGNGFTITPSGSPAVSQNSPFVSYDTTNGSGYFDGTGDYLSVVDNAAFTLGSGDFTVEVWVYKTTTGTQRFISAQSGSSGANTSASYTLQVNASEKVVGSINSGATNYAATSSGDCPLNAWTHIAFARDGNTLRLYINGVQDGTASVTGVTVNDSSDILGIGSLGAFTSLYWPGYLSNFRLVKGTCVYPSGTTFTPPTAPLTAITNTSLLTLQTRAPATNNGFIDSSPNNFVVTRNGNTTQGSFSPFSPTGWGNYFDGSNDNISVSTSTNLAAGSGAFTVEAWVFTSDTKFMICASQTVSGLGFGYNIDNGTQGLWLGRVGVGVDATSGVQLTYNQWNHVAVTRDGSNNVKFFVNGQQSGSTSTVTTNYGTSAQGLYLGADQDGVTNAYVGYLSNFRYIKGQSILGTATSFTVPTSPLTSTAVGWSGTGVASSITGTVSLLTCQSNRFVDNSPNNLTVTPNNGTSVQAFSPFAPAQSYIPSQIGGSGYFDGTLDSLTGPTSNSAFAFGTGAYSVEAWVYLTGFDGGGVNAAFVVDCGGATNAFNMIVNTNGSLALNKYNVGAVITGNSGKIALNSWNHIAICRNSTASNDTRLFVNGALDTTGTDSNDWTVNTTPTFGGAGNLTTLDVIGYLSGIRIIKSQALATSAFTPPTAPVSASTVGWNGSSTAISGTCSLLLNFTNGGIVDATGKNNLETVANSGVQTSQAKWSPGSMYFDGTTDYLKAPTSELWNLGSGDFAVEFFIRFNSIGASNNAIVGKWGSGAGTYAWIIQINSSQLIFYTGNNGTLGSQLTFAWTPSANIWYFVAVSRTSGNIRAYVDTNQIGTTQPNSHTLSSTAGLCAIGENLDGGGQSQFINGYLDDLRITRGYNRGYSGSTITVPTGPFPLG